jgi:hypothetical protein
MYIDRVEALRYMGYRGQRMDANVEKLLDECIDEVMLVSKTSFLYDIFDMESKEEGLHLIGTTLLLRGKDIKAHLSGAEKCAVMAVTLGLEVDRRIDFYSRTELAKALVFNACAAAAVESLCDTVQGKIEAEARSMGLEITSRYSPGYGDFPIDIQKELSKVLKTYERLGLSVNESSIMIPRKSVTAFIGMKREKCRKENNKCKSCKYSDCVFRKEVDNNGKII